MNPAASVPRHVRYASIAVLLVLFALPCVVGRLAPYMIFVGALLVIFTPSLFTARRLASRNPIDLILLGSFVALSVAFSVTANTPADLLYIFNFAPFLLAIPYRWQLERLARTNGALLIGWLCLAGTAGAFVVALVQIYVLDYVRVGQPIMSPFQYADTAMILGFMSLVGCFAPGKHNRLPFLAGPVIALIAVLLSGTRGALLGAPVLIVVAFGFAVLTARRKGLVLAAGAGAVVLAGALMLGAAHLDFRSVEAFEVAIKALAGGEIDASTNERLTMYSGAVSAFAKAPLFGYGWGDMVRAIYPYVPESTLPAMRLFRHLHNGVLSFGVGAGSIGVVVFLVLSVAPLVAVFRTPRDTQFVCRLYLATVLVAGFAVFQLTIIMLGFEFHTVQYAFMTMAILAFVRDPAQSAEGKALVGSDTAYTE